MYWYVHRLLISACDNGVTWAVWMMLQFDFFYDLAIKFLNIGPNH